MMLIWVGVLGRNLVFVGRGGMLFLWGWGECPLPVAPGTSGCRSSDPIMLGVLVVLPPSRVPRMIVSLWMAYIAARKGTGVHTATDDSPVSRGWEWAGTGAAFGMGTGAHRVPLFQDGPVMELDVFSTVSWCLHKVKTRQANAHDGPWDHL